MATDQAAILDEILNDGLPSAAGGRKKRQGPALELEIVRALEPGDLAKIQDGPAEGPRTLATIRNSHHSAAKLLAEGLSNIEVGLATGYAPSYLSMLKSDPAFRELVSFYEAQTEQAFADVMERAKQVGLSFLDEVQRTLEESPDKVTFREKLEAVELLLVKTGHTKGQGAGPQGRQAAPLTLSVNFVSGRQAEPTFDGPLVEGRVLEPQE